MTDPDWYSPGEIHYTYKTALWVVQHLGSLRGGEWPPGTPDDILCQKSSSHKAPFISAIEAAAEITDRLEKCGEDGLILLAIECWGESEESMAAYFRKPVWVIRKRKKKALLYIASGPARRWHTTKRRKGETYEEFNLRRKR